MFGKRDARIKTRKMKTNTIIVITIIFIILTFIILNCFSYERDQMVGNINNLLTIFPISWIISTDGVKIYLACFAIFSLVAFYWRWMIDLYDQKTSDINGLCEELRHNINLTDELVEFDKSEFYPIIMELLNEMTTNKKLKYSSPCDRTISPKLIIKLKTVIKLKKKPADSRLFFAFRYNYINSALSTKTYFALKSQRIFLNFGHLYYSLMRHNFNIEQFNSKNITFSFLQKEYLDWVHFRLHLQLADLILSNKTCRFVDKEYVEEIRSYLKKKI